MRLRLPIKKFTFSLQLFIFGIFPVYVFGQQSINSNLFLNTSFFIENSGQWDKQVKFLARLNNLNVWITEKGLVYDIFREENEGESHILPGFNNQNIAFDSGKKISGHVIKMYYQSANVIAKYKGKNKLKFFYNFFKDNNSEHWATQVATYKEVLVNDIFPGIDVRYYFDSENFRYDFIINPGADISGLKMFFEGHIRLSLSQADELVIGTTLGEMLNNNLNAFQSINDRLEAVSCKFVLLDKNCIGFETGTYNHSLPLIIDPLVYSTYLGGNFDDQLQSIVVDKYRNAYVTGFAYSTNFPTTAGAYKTTRGQFRSGIITQLDPGGFPVFSTYLGDSTNILDLAIDTSGNVYVTGWTGSHNFPVTSGSFQTVSKEPGAGGAEGFLTKLNSDGTALIFSTYLGGKGFDFPSSICLDKQQNAFVAGTTYSSDFPLSNSAMQIIKSGFNDCFITKFDKLGKSLIYSTFLGGKSVDVANDIVIDSIGNAFVAGRTQSSDFYTTNGSFREDSVETPVMGFLSKINRFGTNMIYSTFLAGKGGTGVSNSITGVEIDKAGCAYVTGFTSSDSFPVTPGSLMPTTPAAGITHAFIAKFSPQADSLMYSTYFGGNNTDYSYNINVDILGNAIIGGTTNSNNLPTTPDAFQNLNNGISDVFMAMLNPKGNKLFYCTYLGGENSDVFYKLFYDSSYNVYITGLTTSNIFPVSSGAYQPTKPTICSPLAPPCYSDGFVSRLNLTPPAILTDPVAGFPTCAGTYISVPYSVRSLFDTGNKFILQLSDTNGSFALPLNIGSKSGRGPGSITAQLPVNLKYGTKYRFRVVASSPAVIGSDNGTDLTIDSATIRNFAISDTVGCLNNNSFLYSFDTAYLSQITRYLWRFGDGDTSNLLNPQHSYKTADTFMASLELTNKLGCIDTLTKKILVFPSPKAMFTIPDSAQCFLGNTFDFINNSAITTGNLTNFWTFGDGDSAFTTDASHSYLIADTFIVKLFVISDHGCDDSAAKTVYLSPSPKAGFSTKDTAQCLNGNNFPFTNLTQNPGGNTLTFNWSFGDGTSDTAVNPPHFYTVDSTYSVELKVISNIGCSDSVVKVMIVGSEPNAAFLVNDTNQCQMGNKFIFTNLTQIRIPGTINYLWDFGDGNSDTSTHPVHSYAADGSYTVQLNAVTEVGCKDSSFMKISVLPKPMAGFLVNDSDQCLTGNSFVFKNLTTKMGSWPHNYQWNFGDGNSDTATNPIHSFATADTFMIELTAISGIGCADTVKKEIVVFPMPLADFSVNTNPQPLSGNSFVFTNLSNTFNQGTPSWLWDFGDGDTSSQINASHSYKTADTFYVTLYATSGKGCKDTLTKKIWLTKILPQFWVDFKASNACKGEYVLFTNTSTIKNDSFLNFMWDFGDGTTTIVRYNPQHMYSDTGTYQVKLVGITYGGFKDSVTYPVRIMPKPNLNINYKPDTIVVEGSKVTLTAVGAYDSIFWSTGAQTSSIEVDSTDLYSVRIVDINGCDSSASIHVLFYENEEFSAMTVITPNADGYNDLWKVFSIEKYQPCKLTIYNRWGNVLYTSLNYQNNWDGTYQGKILPAGAYYFVLEAKDGKVFKGVVNVYN